MHNQISTEDQGNTININMMSALSDLLERRNNASIRLRTVVYPATEWLMSHLRELRINAQESINAQEPIENIDPLLQAIFLLSTTLRELQNQAIELIEDIRSLDNEIDQIQSQPQYNDGYSSILCPNCLFQHHLNLNPVVTDTDDTDDEDTVITQSLSSGSSNSL